MRKAFYLLICVVLAACQPLDIGGWKSPEHVNNKSADEIMDLLGIGTGPAVKPDEVQLHTGGRNFTNLTVHTTINVGDDSDPDISNDGRWLMFASTRNSKTNDIFMKELGTKRVTQLTMDPSQDIHPRFSPDGRSMVFASNRHEGQFDIYVLPLFDRKGRRIHATPIKITQNGRNNIHPCYSPDGNSIVFCSYNQRGKTWELWVYDHLERAESMIGYGLLPEWSPDGRHIAYERFRNRDKRFASVWICDPDGSNPSEIVGDRDYGAVTPSWSPDGKYITFATIHRSKKARAEGRINRGDNIWYIPAIGGTPVQVTQFEGIDSQPVWKMDRHGTSRIFFISHRKHNLPKIWSAKPVTTEDLPGFD